MESYERTPLFILIDTDLKGLVPFYDHVNELDDKPVLAMSDLDDFSDYKPNGDFHVVDTYNTPKGLSRWTQLVFASRGVRIYTDQLDDESPVWAGPVPSLDKIRKITVDGAFAEGRAGLFAGYGVNYIGRTKLNPRNIFVLDNKKGNPLHDPAKDATLEALYGSLPDDWWGSCAFVSTANADKLEAFFEAFPDMIPLAYTTGGFAKLKFFALDYVKLTPPDGTAEYGINVREASNRLSYKLSEPEEVEAPANPSWLQL
jgi:hypothetical protein